MNGREERGVETQMARDPPKARSDFETMEEGYCLDWGFKSGLRVEGLSSGAINTGETNLTNLRFSKEKTS